MKAVDIFLRPEYIGFIFDASCEIGKQELQNTVDEFLGVQVREEKRKRAAQSNMFQNGLHI